MKLTIIHARMLACGLSLSLLPFARANDANKMFSAMDTDGNGQISRSEHAAGAKKMFADMDTNHDGVVTVAEMDAVHSAGGDAKNAMSSAEKIKVIDQDGDGKLTAEEHAAGSEAMFAKMDKNGDGSLSREEFEAGHKMLKKDKHAS